MKTFTSTLVCSLMLAGSAVIAMEHEYREEQKSLSVSQGSEPILSDEAWLTKSGIDTALVKKMYQGSKPDASDEDKISRDQASTLIQQNVLEEKNQNSDGVATPISLTDEEKEAVNWFRSLFTGWFSTQSVPEEVTTSTTPVNSTPLETKTEDSIELSTSENVVKVELPVEETIKPSLLSYFTRFNPFNWGTPTTEANVDVVVVTEVNDKATPIILNNIVNNEENSSPSIKEESSDSVKEE